MTATDFFSSLSDKKVAFVGMGVSNNDTLKLFATHCLTTIVCDKREANACDSALIAQFKELGVELRLGEDYLDKLDMDIIVRAPGVYFNRPEFTQFRKRGGILTSEMELFFDLCPCKTIAVTGSDGKTTTTTLIAEMLKIQGKTVHLGGNIGRALLPVILAIKPQDYAVVELSSFQLISMRCSPDISVIKNVTPNHLDVHGTMEEYISAKKNIYLHQNAFSITVLNADDDITASFEGEVRGRTRWFSLKKQVCGAWLKDGKTLCCTNNKGETAELFDKNEIRLPGLHNTENYLTAIAVVGDIISKENMRKIAAQFGGVEHRMEFVREKAGVKWYNDSIASSPTRVIAGLRAFNRKITVIAGGYDKKIPFEPLAPEIIKYVDRLILTGPTAPKIEKAITQNPDYTGANPPIIHAENLTQAVQLADKFAKSGDIISLSPACASFDAYPNFEVRGKHFKELVNSL